MACRTDKRDKNEFAETPPMGWNSWDCYGAAVREEQIRGNADYMAAHMKAFGWEYIVCDIQWYEPEAHSTSYNAFFPLEMDGYSRLIPAENRFPSSAGEKGFRPIADYVHGLGLKFGIHIMRGIPRQAVHRNTAIKGTDARAREIALTDSICPWNTDMYGVDPDRDGAQEYYDSLFELYAEWGVDLVKVDDICNTKGKPLEPYSAKREIELIRNAIDRCGRPMVLSLSPGPAVPEEAEHLMKNANMWRLTDDFWDNWDQLRGMFDSCRLWQGYPRKGCWPDCDMLPVGHIGINTPGHDSGSRYTRFTRAEQRTMLSLWCIFRSPLMVGGELRDNDPWTLELLTNPEVLRILTHSDGAGEAYRTDDVAAWTSRDEDGGTYAAVFNLSNEEREEIIDLERLGCAGKRRARDLWDRSDLKIEKDRFSVKIGKHDVLLLGFR